MVDQLEYRAPLGKSDHLVLSFDYICHADRASDRSKLLRRINHAELIARICESPYCHGNDPTADEVWTSFIGYFQFHIDACSKYIPKEETIQKRASSEAGQRSC